MVVSGPRRVEGGPARVLLHDLLPITPPLELFGALRLRGLTPAAAASRGERRNTKARMDELTRERASGRRRLLS